MQAQKKQLKQNLALIFFSTLLTASSFAMAETDFASQERLLKARVKNYEQKMDHSAHLKPVDKALEFHGVFYGYLPCKDCDGIKATLSLKQNNNYLLVTQPAKESAREFYEKGKYTWNENKHTVVLTSRKDSTIRQYFIANEGELVQLNSDGTQMTEDRAERFTLRRSDTVKSREVHIH
ncbi:MAG: copper resistance protein NlpE [Methylovulum miyakonense]|uniref:copper resistance protein NlpE n=1 Tax=Methylovulum miyakonense TaxID=645578 RepID=UPI003BB51123